MKINNIGSNANHASRFRSAGNDPTVRNQIIDFVVKEFGLSDKDFQVLIDYLSRRKLEVKAKDSFGVVYAITQYCNLVCRHCGANARFGSRETPHANFETSFDEVRTIIDEVQSYTRANNLTPFFMFGGGEPTLRRDFSEILAYAARELGSDNVGFCTNGTNWKVDDLAKVHDYVGVIEVSIDGPEPYHNNWRRTRELSGISNAFRAAMSLVSESIKDEALRQKLEVASIVSKDNLELLPDFAKALRNIGVQTYSVHRAMPVGRMARNLGKIPDRREYIHFLVAMARLRKEDWSFGLHLHHSLESIYSALFLGEDIHQSQLPMGSKRHSIGIDWSGSVHFDPWSLVPPFEKLSAGNLLNNGVNLASLMEDSSSIMHLAGELVKKNVRCKRCVMPCTGGMRLNAISHYIQTRARRPGRGIAQSHLVAGLSQIDPACPLYSED